MALNNQVNKLYGGLGYKDYYDMVEKSAKKLSDNDKQKSYSASTIRKKCEAEQKKILANLIKDKSLKEKIKDAKKDILKAKTEPEKTKIEGAQTAIRQELSNKGNENPELRFLDCTSGKLLKYLIRIELQNYKKCLIEKKKYEKSIKKGSSAAPPKQCVKDNFLKIVKKDGDKYYLNTEHILKLITDMINSFSAIKTELGRVRTAHMTNTNKNVATQASNDKKQRKKTKPSFDIPKISQNEITKIIKVTLNLSPPIISEEQLNGLKLENKDGTNQTGGGFYECYRIAKWCIFWGFLTFFLGGFVLLFMGIMIGMSCGIVDLFTPNYVKTYQVTYDTAYNKAPIQQSRPQYQQQYSQPQYQQQYSQPQYQQQYSQPQYSQQQYNQQYVGPNLNKASTDLVRGAYMAADSVATGIVNLFTPGNRFRGGTMLGLSGGVGKNPKADPKDKKVISIDALSQQIDVAQIIFTKFKTDIENIDKIREAGKGIESNKVCAYNSDDTCFESRKNLNYIKKLLKSMDSIFDYTTKQTDVEAKQFGLEADYE